MVARRHFLVLLETFSVKAMICHLVQTKSRFLHQIILVFLLKIEEMFLLEVSINIRF